MQHRAKFLGMLIALGLGAIAISLILLYGLPYWHEQQLEVQDAQRLNGLQTLQTALSTIFPNYEFAGTPLLWQLVSASSTGKQRESLALNETVYISLPSDSPTCSGLALPLLPQGWQYHCVSAENLDHADGTGWLPVNIAAQNQTITRLPVDPANSPAKLEYYAYVQNGSTTDAQFALASALDSKKYTDVILHGKSADPMRQVLGNVALWSTANNLIGYWHMAEGGGAILHDASGNGKTFLVGDPSSQWTDECPQSCLSFNGSNQRALLTGNIEDINTTDGITITAWVNLAQNSMQEAYELIDASPLVLYAYVTNPTLDLMSAAYVAEQHFFANKSATSYNEWHQVGIVYGYFKDLGSYGVANILDGKIISLNKVQRPLVDSIDNIFLNGRSAYHGQMKNLAIYSRMLSSNEIANIYWRSK